MYILGFNRLWNYINWWRICIFAGGSSLILQAMDPSFSNFLVWCLDISGGTRFRILFLLATPQRECNKYSTGFPQNPWFVGLWVDIFLLKKPWLQTENTRNFTKIVETKDQNCPKSQAGVVDYGHEPERMMWDGTSVTIHFHIMGFLPSGYQIYSQGQERRMLWMQGCWVLLSNQGCAQHKSAQCRCCMLLCSSVWWRRNQKKTFMHLYHIWKSDTGHSQTHDEHDGSQKNIHNFWKKMNICNPTVHPDLASSMSAKSQPMFRMGTLPAPFTLFLAIFQTYPRVI